MLDQLYEAPLGWPAAERTPRMENALRKITALAMTDAPVTSPPPLSGIEAKFLIGANFRLILRDAIYSSQLRHNQGIIQQPLRTMRREPVYREILQYSFEEYIQKFVIPAYRERGLDLAQGDIFEKGADLRAHEATLKGDPRLHVLVNQNDFLLDPADLAWLRDAFGPEQLTVFPHGGHLGNLGAPEVQGVLLKALSGLK